MSMTVASLVMSCVLAAIFIPQIIILWAIRTKPCLRHRSPSLVIISTIGNLLYSIAISHTFFMLQIEEYSSYIYSYINLLITWFFYPIYVLPYFVRTIKIYSVFQAGQIVSSNLEDNMQCVGISMKKIRSNHFAKVTAVLLIVLLSLSAAVCTLYYINPDLGNYLFLDFQLKDFQAYQSGYIAIHKYALMFGYFFIFLQEMFFIFLYLIIRNINNNFNIKGEMICTLIIWELTSVSSGILQVASCGCDENDAVLICLYAISMFRGLSCLFISVTLPLIKSNDHKKPFLPYGETKECCESLVTLLTSQTACGAFLKYLADNSNYKNYLLLYMKAKSYELMKKERKKNVVEFWESIVEQFFKDDSPFKIAEKDYVCNHINSVKDSPVKREISKLLILLCLTKLSRYYKQFKQSNDYVVLQRTLQKKELLYELLHKAGLN